MLAAVGLETAAGCVKPPVPEFIDPLFRENKPKTLIFSHRKRAFWACFRENWVYKFGHRGKGFLCGSSVRSIISGTVG